MHYFHLIFCTGAKFGANLETHIQIRIVRIIDLADFQDDINQIYKTNKVLKLEDHIKIYPIETISSKLGCLYIMTCYEMNFITRKCIETWNLFSKYFNSNLSSYSELKIISNCFSLAHTNLLINCCLFFHPFLIHNLFLLQLFL